MSQQPKTETDRLANVIQVLQMGQNTGRLIVERNDGPRFEQGVITLVNGQIVQASVNQLQGPEAFNRLKNWGTCRFAFTPDPRAGTASRLPSLPSPSLPTPPARPQGWSRTGNLVPGTSPLRNPTQGTSPLHGPAPESQHPGANIHNHSTRYLGEVSQAASVEWSAAPHRTRQIEEGMHLIEQMGLSRTHRRLFLLIDGSRTVKELMRLISHNPEDAQRLLRDLERAGVIQV